VATRGAPLPSPALWRAAPAAQSAPLGVGAELAALVFFFVFWANLAVVATRFHGVPQLVASAVTALLVFPIAKYLFVDREPLVVTPVLPLAFAFVGALFLSSAVSTEPEVARGSVATYLTEGLLLYLLVSNAVRTTRTLTRVVWVLIVAGALLGALSVFQELTHTYSNDYGGLAQVDRLDSGGGFNIAPEDSGEKILRPRLGGPLGSENRYAQILAVLFPLALVRAFREPKRRLRLTAGVCTLLITGGLLLTFSRGGAVGVAATLLAMILIRELRLRHLVVLLASITAVVAFAVPDYVTRLSSLEGVTSLSSGDSSGSTDAAIVGRATENLAAWHTFLDHPLVGVGPGVYFHEYSRDYANRLGLRYLASERRGHSLYLEMAADTGMVGLGAFLAMVTTALVFLYRHAKHWRSRDRERSMLASSFFFALLAYLATGAFLHLSYQRYFWVVLGLGSAVIWRLEQDRRSQAGSEERSPGLRTSA
jgi:hypothetical protein